jgi:hypothetical protein
MLAKENGNRDESCLALRALKTPYGVSATAIVDHRARSSLSVRSSRDGVLESSWARRAWSQCRLVPSNQTIQRDEAGQSIDLLRHDAWWPRDQYVCLLSKEAAARSFPAPELPDWPFAVNLFARTLVGADGTLTADVGAVVDGAKIELTTGFDVVIGVIAAGQRSPAIEVTVGL